MKRRSRLCLVCFVVAFAMALPTSILAQEWDLSDPAVRVNGAAVKDGGIFVSKDELNSRGSFFHSDAMPIDRSFWAWVKVSLTKSTTTPYTADGVGAFCVQSEGAGALGAMGQGKGFYGIRSRDGKPGVCLALINYVSLSTGERRQMNLWTFYRTDQLPPASGNLAQLLSYVNLNNNIPKDIWVDYDQYTKRFTAWMKDIFDDWSRADEITSEPMDLPVILGRRTGWFGGTGGTATFSQIAEFRAFALWY